METSEILLAGVTGALLAGGGSWLAFARNSVSRSEFEELRALLRGTRELVIKICGKLEIDT